MRKEKFKISPGAVLLAALLFYLGEPEELLALLLAIAAHELGHVAALFFLGLKVRSFRAEARGLCIDYRGHTGALGHALTAALGPLSGLIYAFAASRLGDRLGLGWLCLSSGLSLVLSLFNLLPALPLDGGRIFESLSSAFLGERRGRALSQGLSFGLGLCLLVAGGVLMVRSRGAAVFIAGIWVLLYQEREGIVNRREIL